MWSDYFAVGILWSSVCFAKADEFCDGRYCPDSGSNIAYCCDPDEYEGFKCCWYQAWYGTWYFWFGLILGIVVLVCLITMCRKSLSRHRGRRCRSTERAEYRREAVPSVSGIQTEEPEVTLNVDVLPTYEEIQAQGISKEFLQYAETEGVTNSACDVTITDDIQ